MTSRTTNLDQLIHELWTALQQSTATHNHPWRTPVLGSSDREGLCALRTVILREVALGDFSLTAFTDIRSPKVASFRHLPTVRWLFYDPHRQEQLLLTGTIAVVTAGPRFEQAWQATPESNRRNYRFPHPSGTPLSVPPPEIALLPEEHGVEHFCLLDSRIHRVEWLGLSTQGNFRAGWDLQDGLWNGSWLAP